MSQIKVIVATRHVKSGKMSLPMFTVEAENQQQVHAVLPDLVNDAGYSAPFRAYFEEDFAVFKEAAVALGLVPSQVAIDISGGAIHQVRCDQGSVDVLLYDTQTDGCDEADCLELPIGNNGTWLDCGAWFWRSEPCPHVGAIFEKFRSRPEEDEDEEEQAS